MTVRCKFKVDTITRHNNPKHVKQADGSYKSEPGEMHTIVLSPVYGNGDPNHENTKFWQASPSGRFELGCANPEATKQFDVGAEYYIDITPAK
jgi:hypothetical protein